jgi:hypothetical protein
LALTVTRTQQTVAFTTLLLVLAACAGPTEEATPSAPVSLEYDHRAGALVVEADTFGGLQPPSSGRHVPEVRVYGDGLVVVATEDQDPRVGIDRAVTIGYLEEGELDQLLAFIAESGFFGLDERYMPSAAPPDSPWRHVLVNLTGGTKTVSIYPFDYSDTPSAFSTTYEEILSIRPAEPQVFTPASGTLSVTDLGPIEGLPAGQANQVAPWDTPLVGVALPDAEDGMHLGGEEYGIVEEFLLRYPAGQLFGSQEGRAYQVLLEADLPWEEGSQ